MTATRHEYRVIYGDTDEHGIVYHANYLRWFEAARCEYLRARGGSYADTTRRGIHFPVVEAFCKFRRPVHFEDLVVVEVRLTDLKRVAVRFAYEVRVGSDPALVAEGHTLHGCTDEGGRLVRIPEDVRRLLLAEPV